jgi:PAS domain S-box-containing protein
MVTVLKDVAGSKVRPGKGSLEVKDQPPESWQPQEAAQALVSNFAEALARKAEVADGVKEALRFSIETRLLSAGCVYEVPGQGDPVLRVQAGFSCGLVDLCGQAWLLGDALDAGLPVRVPSARVPLAAAVDLLRHAGATAALVVPLIALGERVGAMVLAARDVDLLDDALVASSRVVGAQVARALTDARVLRETRLSEQRHRTAFERAQDALLLLDRDGLIIEANGQAERLLDRGVAELLGRSPADFTPPEDVLILNALQTQLLTQGYLDVHRMRVRRRDGRVLDMDATAARVPCNGGFVQILVLRDMTNRRRAREGLIPEEERLRGLIDSTGDTIFTLDRCLRVTAVQGRRPQDAGLDPKKSVGESLGDALAHAPAAHLAAARQALLGAVTTFEWTAHADDGPRYLETTFSPVTGSDGDVTSVVGISRDVTERRQLQTRLLVADHMASLGLVATGLAHELSAPVADMLANLSHLNEIVADVQSHALAGEQAVDLAELVHTELPLRDAFLAADRLRHIIQDLRSLTRQERLGPVEIEQVLVAAARMAASVLKPRARVVCHFQDGLFTLGNEALLIQAFLSLIVNAAQACPERGESRYEVRLTTWRDGRGRVVAEVRDTGCGIAPEHLDRIFEPFFTTRAPGVGTGLGLSIAQRILTALGGEIEVESVVGTGTAVRVVLTPAAAPEVPLSGPSGDVPRA